MCFVILSPFFGSLFGLCVHVLYMPDSRTIVYVNLYVRVHGLCISFRVIPFFMYACLCAHGLGLPACVLMFVYARLCGLPHFVHACLCVRAVCMPSCEFPMFIYPCLCVHGGAASSGQQEAFVVAGAPPSIHADVLD